MIKKSTLKIALSVLLVLGTGQIFARTTPMDALIYREHQNHSFTAVTGMWQTDTRYTAADMSKYTDKASFFTLDFNSLNNVVSEKDRDITLSIPKNGGGTYEIDLAQYNFLTPDFKVQSVANNTPADVSYTPGVYYRGVVNGIPNSVASFSFFNDEVYGLFSIPNVGNFVIAHNKLAGKQDKQHYILYNDADLKIARPGGCSADDLPVIVTHKDLNAVERKTYNTCKDFKIFLKADYEAYVDAGGMTALTNYFTSTFNSISTLYQNEGIYVSLKTIQANTTSDNYQSLPYQSDAFLNEFGFETQNNLNGADLAMLVSTLDGTMGGVAWLGTLCSSYFVQQTQSGNEYVGPYSFVNTDYALIPALPTFSWDVEAMTHEMGHNFGSPHTHNCTAWPGGPIDGCYTLEGNCAEPVPQYPVNGGTIMSYCHLVSNVGINLANGFGHYPGDTVRYGAAMASCGSLNLISAPVTVANTSVIANHECTDPNGITYYWNDYGTSDQSDDKVALLVKKNGVDIGNLDSTGFSVTSGTVVGYGTNTGVQIVLPAGASSGILDSSFAIRRYWQLIASTAPTNNIEILFPYTATDITDIAANVPGHPVSDSSLMMYTVNYPVNPNPALGIGGATAANCHIYTHGNSPSLTQWTRASISGNAMYASFLTAAQKVGGSAFRSFNGLSVSNVPGNAALTIFPNPAHNAWTVYVPNSIAHDMQLQLYTTDGKMVQQQLLHTGTNNNVDASKLPAGMYYYRIIGDNLYTGNLLKQ